MTSQKMPTRKQTPHVEHRNVFAVQLEPKCCRISPKTHLVLRLKTTVSYSNIIATMTLILTPRTPHYTTKVFLPVLRLNAYSTLDSRYTMIEFLMMIIPVKMDQGVT